MKTESVKVEIVIKKTAKLEVGDIICLTKDNNHRYYAVVLEPMCSDFNNLNDGPVAKIRQLSNGLVFTWYKSRFTNYEFVTHLDGYAYE